MKLFIFADNMIPFFKNPKYITAKLLEPINIFCKVVGHKICWIVLCQLDMR